MYETEAGSMSLSCKTEASVSVVIYWAGCACVPLTGTFFWEMTTAQSLPRTPTDVMLAAVIALKAYSGPLSVDCASPEFVLGGTAYRLGITGLGPRRW